MTLSLFQKSIHHGLALTDACFELLLCHWVFKCMRPFMLKLLAMLSSNQLDILVSFTPTSFFTTLSYCLSLQALFFLTWASFLLHSFNDELISSCYPQMRQQSTACMYALSRQLMANCSLSLASQFIVFSVSSVFFLSPLPFSPAMLNASLFHFSLSNKFLPLPLLQ